MKKALFVLYEPEFAERLKGKLNVYFPEIGICGCCKRPEEVISAIQCNKPSLVFIDIDTKIINDQELFHLVFDKQTEVIFISNILDHAIRAINYQVSGYLLKPIQDQELITAVRNANDRFTTRERFLKGQELMVRSVRQLPPNDIIGIPTIEGLEFLSVSEIIRCQGLQKCTRVVICSQKDIISSYNIGAFCKMLAGFGFFSTHKSHLINLRHIKRYLREGTVIMKDDSTVPVSKRKKKEFLDLLVHV